MAVKIVTDSTVDLSPELAEELGITVVPIYVRFGEEVYRDGADIGQEEFYQRLRESPVHPTTSQPAPADFADVYRRLSEETDEIVSVHVSSRVSGTCNAALQGKEMAGTGAHIEVLDSFSVSMGLGLITMAAARLAKAGESLQVVMEEVKQTIPRVHILGVFDTLKYLLKGGRIGKAKALVGTVLNVKPLLTMRDGEISPLGMARTRAKGIERLFDTIKSALSIQELAIVHSTTPDEAASFKERIASIFDRERIHIARLGPALGVHGGPGVLLLAFRERVGGEGQGTDGGGPSGRRFSLPSLQVPRLNIPNIPKLRFSSL